MSVSIGVYFTLDITASDGGFAANFSSSFLTQFFTQTWRYFSQIFDLKLPMMWAAFPMWLIII